MTGPEGTIPQGSAESAPQANLDGPVGMLGDKVRAQGARGYRQSATGEPWLDYYRPTPLPRCIGIVEPRRTNRERLEQRKAQDKPRLSLGG